MVSVMCGNRVKSSWSAEFAAVVMLIADLMPTTEEPLINSTGVEVDYLPQPALLAVLLDDQQHNNRGVAFTAFGLGHRFSPHVPFNMWSAATRRRMIRKAATSRRTPQTHPIGLDKKVEFVILHTPTGIKCQIRRTPHLVG